MNVKTAIEQFTPYNEQEACDKALMLRYLTDFDDVLTRKNPLCHFTASSWITNREHNKILMVYHNIYKSWSWIGGHADGEPDMYKVAVKEAQEETGITGLKPLCDGIYSLEILTVDSHIKRGSFVSSHLHLDCCYLFEADEAAEIRIKEDENSGVQWVDIDKVPEITNEECMKPIYAKLNEKLKNCR